MITFIERMFESHIKTKSKVRQMLFKRFALYTDLIVKFGSIMYFGAGLMFLPYPIYMYICENQNELLIPAYIPGMDSNTPSGYCILMLAQAFTLSIGSAGLCCCDVFYALILSNVPIMARLIEDEVHQLNEMLEENSYDTWTRQFCTIIMMHQKLTTYIILNFKLCTDIFY